MSAALDTVNRFLKAFEATDGYRAAVRDYFTADCVYENVGLSNTVGPADAIAFFDGFKQATGFSSLTVETRDEVANGQTVMNERVDHLYNASGQRLLSLRVMGVFEVRGNKIIAWRDYFDSKALG